MAVEKSEPPDTASGKKKSKAGEPEEALAMSNPVPARRRICPKGSPFERLIWAQEAAKHHTRDTDPAGK